MGSPLYTFFFGSIKNGTHDFVKSIQLEVTEKCYTKCAMCKRWEKKDKDVLDFETTKKFLNDFEKLGGETIRFTGGEPLTYPEFAEFEKLNPSLKYTITTTLVTKDKKKLEAIANRFTGVKVSFSGAGDMYEKIHGVDYYENVVRNLGYLVKKGVKPTIALVLNSINLENLDWVDRYINVMHLIRPGRITITLDLFEEERGKKEIKEFYKKFEKCPVKYTQSPFHNQKIGKNLKKMKCIVPYIHWHVKASGEVYPCCMTGGEIGQELDKNMLLGNIKEQSLEEIFNKGKEFAKIDDIYNKFKICKEQCYGGVRYFMANQDYNTFESEKKMEYM